MQEQNIYIKSANNSINMHKEEFFKEGLAFFPTREEQLSLYQKSANTFKEIFQTYMHGERENKTIINKLLKLLEDLEFFDQPYIFDSDIIEEAVGLDLIITDMIKAIG